MSIAETVRHEESFDIEVTESDGGTRYAIRRQALPIMQFPFVLARWMLTALALFGIVMCLFPVLGVLAQTYWVLSGKAALPQWNQVLQFLGLTLLPCAFGLGFFLFGRALILMMFGRRIIEIRHSGLVVVHRYGAFRRTKSRLIDSIRRLALKPGELFCDMDGAPKLVIEKNLPQNQLEELGRILSRRLRTRFDLESGPGVAARATKVVLYRMGRDAWIERTKEHLGARYKWSLAFAWFVASSLLFLLHDGSPPLGKAVICVFVLGPVVWTLGLAALWGIESLLARRALEPPVLIASIHPLRLGERFEVVFRQRPKRAVTVQSVTLRLVCRESATKSVSEGPDQHYVSDSYSTEVDVLIGPIEARAGSVLEEVVEFEIPPQGMHSFGHPGFDIDWVLETETHLAGLPDDRSCFGIEVLPERVPDRQPTHV